MQCIFSKRQEEYDLEVKMGEDVTLQVSVFKYLRSILQNEKEIIKDVK